MEGARSGHGGWQSVMPSGGCPGGALEVSRGQRPRMWDGTPDAPRQGRGDNLCPPPT
jgi:hypothetical protein